MHVEQELLYSKAHYNTHLGRVFHLYDSQSFLLVERILLFIITLILCNSRALELNQLNATDMKSITHSEVISLVGYYS